MQHRNTVQNKAIARTPRFDISLPAVLKQGSMAACATPSSPRSLQCYILPIDISRPASNERAPSSEPGTSKAHAARHHQDHPENLSETSSPTRSNTIALTYLTLRSAARI